MRWLIPALLFLLPLPARADVCVTVDAERDMLEPREQRAAELLVADLLVAKGLDASPDATGCLETYRLHHVVFGDRITVTLAGPAGTRQSSVQDLAEVPSLYSQLVNALLAEQPLANSNASVDRRNVTWDLSYAPRVEAEGLWFLRLGGGAQSAPEASVGPALGVGYRHELDTLGIEASFFEFRRAENDRGSDQHVSFIKLMGLRYVDPVANSTPVFGAGISWSRAEVWDGNRTLVGNGVELHVRGAYELLRASTVRMFVQAEAGLPLYLAKPEGSGYWDSTTQSTVPADAVDDAWVPSLTISFGIGWANQGY